MQPSDVQKMTDADLAAFPVRMLQYGEHTEAERAVIGERLRRSEIAAERAMAARGLPVGGRIRLRESYRRMMTNGHWAGREGEILRPGISGTVYVRLDKTPRERTEKEILVSMDDLEPVTVQKTALFGHNGGPPLEDMPAPVRIVPPSGTSLKRIALTMPPESRIRAVPVCGGYALHQMSEDGSRPLGTLGYANHAQTAEHAIAAFIERMEAVRIDQQVTRITVTIGPRYNGAYGVYLLVDNETRSTSLPFAGHRGYCSSRQAAEIFAREQRRAAAVALIAYESANGSWLAKLERDRDHPPTPLPLDRAAAAQLIHIAMTKPRSGKGTMTPAALMRSMDLKDEAAALAEHVSSGRPAVRVLVMPCSATKRPDPAPLPARSRYTGPLWQTYRAIAASAETMPRTVVLSAEFGVIEPSARIPYYDRLLDEDRAAELASDPIQLDRMATLLDGATEVYVIGGAVYRATVTAMVKLLRQSGRLPHTMALTGPEGLGIGQQRAALAAWLALEPPQCPATSPFTAGQRIEAQRRGPGGMVWEVCIVIAPTLYGVGVRFPDGLEVPRTLDSVRASEARQEAA
jgi:hypothetical protein